MFKLNRILCCTLANTISMLQFISGAFWTRAIPILSPLHIQTIGCNAYYVRNRITWKSSCFLFGFVLCSTVATLMLQLMLIVLLLLLLLSLVIIKLQKWCFLYIRYHDNKISNFFVNITILMRSSNEYNNNC